MPEKRYRSPQAKHIATSSRRIQTSCIRKSDKGGENRRVGDSRVESNEKIGKLVICSENRR